MKISALSQNNLKLELPTVQTIHIEVYNIMGQKIATRLISGQSLSEPIDLSHLSAGWYLVKIKTDVGIAKKWVVVGR